jgi:hypothetical protein
MSATIVGEAVAIFTALSEAFNKAAGSGELVMTVTVSNA